MQKYDWNTNNSTEYTEKKYTLYSMKQPSKAYEILKFQIIF